MATTNGTGLVLIHGAELGAWLWERMLPSVQAPALAIDLPGRGHHPAEPRQVHLSDSIAIVADDVVAWGQQQVVLVAHSFSGVLVPALAERLGDRVGGVVLVGASVPQAGTSWLGLQPWPNRLALRILYGLRPGGMLSPAADNRKNLCNDLDEETTEWFLQRRVVEPPGHLTEPVPTATFPDVPIHVITMRDDRAAPPAQVPRAARHELDGGHLPMLSRPQELAALLDDIVGQLGTPLGDVSATGRRPDSGHRP